MASSSNQTKMVVNNVEVTIRRKDGQVDYISLTDIAKAKGDEPNSIIQHWMRNGSTIEYLGLWETLFNPVFDKTVCDEFLGVSGGNSFTMSPKKWIESTRAIGIESKSGRYGGTFAHFDIALEFMSWISPALKLYFIQDYQRLKADDSQRRLGSKRDGQFLLTEADDSQEKVPFMKSEPRRLMWEPSFEEYSEEDVIDISLFGTTQKEAEQRYTEMRGPIRENTNIQNIIIHWSLRTKNAELISEGLSKRDRLEILNQMAMDQYATLTSESKRPLLPEASSYVQDIQVNETASVTRAE